MAYCIESILNQTYNNLEIILIDDGSVDTSSKICDEFALKDKRIKVFHQKNSGVSVARNKGLDVMEGEYFTFVDSDDYLEVTMYEKMMEVAQLYDCDMVMCDCIKESYNYEEIYTHDIREGYYNEIQLRDEYYSRLLITPNLEYPATISNWVCLTKTSIGNIRYKEGIRFSEDWLYGAQLIKNAKSFYYMKGCALYHYRMNENSVTHIFKKDKWDDYQKLYLCIYDIFSKMHDYDFSSQIDKVLIFLVYNAVGDLMNTNQVAFDEKIKIINKILKSKEVKAVFKRIKINDLLVSNKLKVQTFMYKYRLGIRFLCRYKEKIRCQK